MGLSSPAGVAEIAPCSRRSNRFGAADFSQDSLIMSIASPARAETPSLRAAAALIGAVTALALAGAALAVIAPGLGHAGGELRRLAPAETWRATASFGSIEVQAVERGGVRVHETGHDAADRSDQVRVHVALTNRQDRAVAYSPGQFRLGIAETGTTISPIDPTPPPDGIRAGVTLEQRLAFVVPAARSSLSLVFDDVGASAPLTLELGRLESPPDTH
jgi:hypothetical protein